MRRESLLRFWDLHTWLGVFAGLVLYFMCLTGSLTLWNDQLSTWQSPASGVVTTTSIDEQLAMVERLHGSLPAELWYHPTSNGAAKLEFDGAVNGAWGAVLLDMQTPALVPDTEILAGFIYNIHYLSHELTGDPLYRLAGFLAVALLLAIVTGVLIHLRDFFRQLTQFRPRKSRRTLWSDMHKVLGVLGLPFQLMYAVTGAYIVLAPLITDRLTGPVFDGDTHAQEWVLHGPELVGPRPREPGPAVATRPIAELIATARAVRPDLELKWLRVMHHGHANGLLEVGGYVEPHPSAMDRVIVREVDGVVVFPEVRVPETPHEALDRWLGGLHYAYFGGLPLRLLFFVLGLATCATILTGNWVWLSRRQARRDHAGHRALLRLTAGIGAGSLLAVALLFLASRVLPRELAARGTWEQAAFFGGLVGATLYALRARDVVRASMQVLGLAGAACIAAVIAQAWCTRAGLFGGGPHVAAIVGVDVALLAAGAALIACYVRSVRRSLAMPPIQRP